VETSHVAHLHVDPRVSLSYPHYQNGAGFSEPQSKPDYETVVACGFSHLTRIAGRVAILPAIGKPYVGSEFAVDLVAQTHSGIQVRET
jgi:hypothetical protein